MQGFRGRYQKALERIEPTKRWELVKQVAKITEEHAEKVAFAAQVQKEMIERWTDKDFEAMGVSRANLEIDLNFSTTILPLADFHTEKERRKLAARTRIETAWGKDWDGADHTTQSEMGKLMPPWPAESFMRQLAVFAENVPLAEANIILKEKIEERLRIPRTKKFKWITPRDLISEEEIAKLRLKGKKQVSPTSPTSSTLPPASEDETSDSNEEISEDEDEDEDEDGDEDITQQKEVPAATKSTQGVGETSSNTEASPIPPIPASLSKNDSRDSISEDEDEDIAQQKEVSATRATQGVGETSSNTEASPIPPHSKRDSISTSDETSDSENETSDSIAQQKEVPRATQGVGETSSNTEASLEEEVPIPGVGKKRKAIDVSGGKKQRRKFDFEIIVLNLEIDDRVKTIVFDAKGEEELQDARAVEGAAKELAGKGALRVTKEVLKRRMKMLMETFMMEIIEIYEE